MRLRCLSLACSLFAPAFASADAVDDFVEAQRRRGGEHDYRYRFFLNDKAEVADASAQAVD